MTEYPKCDLNLSGQSGVVVLVFEKKKKKKHDKQQAATCATIKTTRLKHVQKCGAPEQSLGVQVGQKGQRKAEKLAE